MYIVLALLTFASFAAAVVAVFTGHWWVAAHQLVIFLLAYNNLRLERELDAVTLRNIMLWRRIIKADATSAEGEAHE